MSIEKMSSFSGVHETGTLYLVPTPIGNLGDMTERAVRTLKEVDLICAEDTRNTQKLLNHFEIDTPQISFHEHNTKERIPQLIEKLRAGRNLAQVSDAGMPSISDPGHELVVACIENRIPVAPLPGPNAALTALIASGLLPQPFLFYGFLPRRNKEQREELEKLNSQTVTLIFYEAPHRLKKTVQAMADVFGPDRRVVLCRELTKRYEEFLRGTLLDALEFAEEDEVRGEFVLIVEGNSHVETLEADGLSETTIEESVNALIESGKKPNDAIKEVARRRKMKKQEVYNIFHHLDD